MSWIDFDTSAPPPSDWHDVAVAPSLRAIGDRLASQLGCYCKTIEGPVREWVEREKPEIVLLDSLEAASKLAGALQTGVMTGFEADLDVAQRLLVVKSRAYGGRMIQEWTCPTARPQIAVLFPLAS